MKLWAKAGPQGNGGLNVKNAMEGLTMVSKEMESRIDKFIADNRQNIVNDIAALVNIKSVSQACDNPQAPYGEGCRKVLDKAKSRQPTIPEQMKQAEQQLAKEKPPKEHIKEVSHDR